MTATGTAVAAAMLALCIDLFGGRSQAGASLEPGDTVVSATGRIHLDAKSTLRDLLAHPASTGFAPLILPWDDRAYDEQMPLARIGSLLPYHTHVEPPTFVVVGEQDGIAPPAVMKRRVEALPRSGTAVEYREYKGVGHGFGLSTGTSAEGWVFEAIRLWEKSMPVWPKD